MRRLLIGLILGSATPLAATEAADPPVVTGPAVACVLVQNIRNTRVIDDRTIDFELAGRKLFRNTLPNDCPLLGINRAFSYELSIGQLCAVDIITVINQGGGPIQGARCGLGKFTPIAAPPRK